MAQIQKINCEGNFNPAASGTASGKHQGQSNRVDISTPVRIQNHQLAGNFEIQRGSTDANNAHGFTTGSQMKEGIGSYHHQKQIQNIAMDGGDAQLENEKYYQSTRDQEFYAQ